MFRNYLFEASSGGPGALFRSLFKITGNLQRNKFILLLPCFDERHFESKEKTHALPYCYLLLLQWRIKSRRLRWAGHLVRLEEGMSALKILTDGPAG